MQAYEKSMQRGDTRLVLKPDSDFFRYFSNPSGAMRPEPQPNPPPRAQPAEPANAPESK